jgi:hypothetical protein
MSKVDFIKQFEDNCGDINFNIEHACKISNTEDIVTDKINIIFKKVDKRTLINLSNNIFDNKSKVIDFINKIYSQYEDTIHQILFGYADEYKELYFEIRTPGKHSELGISYDESNDVVSEYKLSDVSNKAKELADDIFNKTGLTLPALNTLKTNLGYIKNNSTYIFLLYEPLSDVAFILKEYYKHMNSNIDGLEDWLQENLSNTLTFIGYKNDGDKISLNIYATDLNQNK